MNVIKLEEKSKRFRFNRADILKILKGAGLAGLGAGATYALVELRDMDFGEWTPFVVMGISVLGNMLRKFVVGRK